MPRKSDGDAPYTRCSLCSQLADQEYALQKGGYEDEAAYLPAASNNLELVKDFKPGSSRALQLKRCRQCGTYYLYTSDYEFLVNGTEDEDFLKRLTDDEAAEYLERPDLE
ncbi:MAG: hypothetical protein Fur0018_23030 [Anaerolineales bacterium]